MISRRNTIFIFLGCLVGVLLGFYLRPEFERITTSNTPANRVNQNSGGGGSEAPFDYDIIGIEFGDSYSRVALSRGGDNVTVILDKDGKAETPSVVAFTNEGVVVGRAAQKLAATNPKNTVSNFRPLIGANLSDPAIQGYIKSVPYDVIEKDGRLHIRVELKGEVKLLTPEEILSHLLVRLKDIADNYRCPPLPLPERILSRISPSSKVEICKSITQGVIAVPSYFDDQQRQAIKSAGVIAGIEILRVVNEPTAASIAHNIDHDTLNYPNESVFLVYNLAHRQLDITLLDIDFGVYEILQANSSRQVGGEDFDNALLNYLVEKYYQPHRVDVLADPKLVAKLKSQAKYAEERFTMSYSHGLSLDHIPMELPASGAFGGDSIFLEPFVIPSLYSQLFTQTIANIKSAMYFAYGWSAIQVPEALNASKIDGVLLLGESSTISKVRPFIEDYFGKGKIITNPEIPSNHAIVRGVAKQGWVLSAYNDDWDCPSMMEIASLSTGIELEGGLYRKVIPRNTVLPTRKSLKITTVRNNQDTILLWIHKGERFLTSHNEPIALLEITSIPPQSKGKPEIEVAFELDADYMFKATAKVLDTGEEFEVKKNDKLFETVDWEDIDRIVMESERFYEEDKVVAARDQEWREEQGRLFGNGAALWADPALRDEL